MKPVIRLRWVVVLVTVASCLAGMPVRAGAAAPDDPAFAPAAPPAAAVDQQTIAELAVTAAGTGQARAIVTVPMPFIPEGLLSRGGGRGQRDEIRRRQDDLFAVLEPLGASVSRRFETIPSLALRLPPAAVLALAASPLVTTVAVDEVIPVALAESTTLVQTSRAAYHGYNGTGSAVAIVDTGVDRSHPFLASRVVAEACFSDDGACPLSGSEEYGAGAAAPCSYGSSCDHGTHVAGIAAGRRTGSAPADGVAPAASVIAANVFSPCSTCAGGAGAYTSDILAGLEWVYSLRATRMITAVNMSLGGDPVGSTCPGRPGKAIVDNLRSSGIATVIASGNGSSSTKLSWPACISTAVSVGSTTDDPPDQISWFSNSASTLDLLAPGEWITSSVPDGGYDTWQGTSMAAPHVAGAWALVRQQHPEWSVTQVLARLRATGLPVLDDRNGVTVPRILVGDALGVVGVAPGPPQNPIASAGVGSATVTFDPPASSGSDPLTGYIVTAAPGGQTATVDGTTLSVALIGLTNGIPYAFTVQATSGAGTGIASAPSNSVTPSRPITDGDYDGDGTTDLAVYRPSTSQWLVHGGATTSWGLDGDIPVAGDYDGNGTTDPAVYRPSTGRWLVHEGATTEWGLGGDVPVPGDYDGNGTTDPAVYRPSTGQWLVHGWITVSWGQADDIPVPGDYDGNGTTDFAVWRPSTGQWFVLGGEPTSWGLPSDIPVPGDYDGNGTTDFAVWRPSTGQWFVLGGEPTSWGLPSDIPVPGDHDGNGTTDFAVWRPSTGQWFVLGGEPTSWGLPSDIPLPIPYAIRSRFF